MTEREIIEKTYQKLDGEITPAEWDEFEDYLSDHPDAARFLR